MRIRRKPEFLFIVLLLVISYFVFVIWKDLRDLGALEAEKKALHKNLEKETVLNRDLKDLAQSLKQNRNVELLARQKLGMVKEGETAFKIIRSK